MPPSDKPGDDPARNRFMIINFMRLAGVAMVLLGIAILADAVELPDIAAYVLIALGLVEALVTPQILARLWSTNGRR